MRRSIRPLIGSEAWAGLLGRLRSLHNQARWSQGAGRDVYDRALIGMASAQETSGALFDALTLEEFSTYVISEHETMLRAFDAWRVT